MVQGNPDFVTATLLNGFGNILYRFVDILVRSRKGDFTYWVRGFFDKKETVLESKE